MNSNPPDRWLIRTTENKISGPFTHDQICQFIQQGKLQLNDEVCQANTYWFSLHEQAEVKGQLGIDLPKEIFLAKGDSTETDVEVERTEPDLEPISERTAAMGAVSSPRTGVRPQDDHEDMIPELSEPVDDVGDNTAVMSNRAFRSFRPKKAQAAPSPGVPQVTNSEPMIPAVPVVRGISLEKSKIFKIMTYLMVVGAVGLLAALLKLLHDQPHR